MPIWYWVRSGISGQFRSCSDSFDKISFWGLKNKQRLMSAKHIQLNHICSAIPKIFVTLTYHIFFIWIFQFFKPWIQEWCLETPISEFVSTRFILITFLTLSRHFRAGKLKQKWVGTLFSNSNKFSFLVNYIGNMGNKNIQKLIKNCCLNHTCQARHWPN